MRRIKISSQIGAFIFIGIFMGVSGYTFHYAKGTSYLSSNPKACVNCHVMQDHYDSWEKSSHRAAASCVSCHLPQEGVSKWLAKIDNGFHHSLKFTLQNFNDPIRITPKNARILEMNCKSCHAGMISQVAATGSHPKFKDSLSCLSCHAQVGHGASN